MNSANITGRLGKDIELRYVESGTAIARFTVAVDRWTKGKRDTDWINVTAFGKQAENASKYLHKGSKCGVTGSIKTGSYERQDGSKAYTFEIWASTIDYLDSREEKQEQQFQGFKPVDEDMPF